VRGGKTVREEVISPRPRPSGIEKNCRDEVVARAIREKQQWFQKSFKKWPGGVTPNGVYSGGITSTRKEQHNKKGCERT